MRQGFVRHRSRKIVYSAWKRVKKYHLVIWYLGKISRLIRKGGSNLIQIILSVFNLFFLVLPIRIPSMKILFWNCRGLGRTMTQYHLKEQVLSFSPSLILLSETLAGDRTANRVARKIGLQNFFVKPPTGHKEGFLLLWTNQVSVEIIDAEDWFVSAQISSHGKSWMLLFIHASYNIDIQSRQWMKIERLCSDGQVPWIVLGDFNAMLASSEKRGGAPLSQRQVNNFQDFVQNCCFSELEMKGPQFTWNNGQHGLARIAEKIDRGFANAEFFNLFPTPLLLSQPMIGSDHCSMIVDLLHENKTKRKPFRFEALWLHENSCEETIAAAWGKFSQHQSLSSRLGNLAFCLKKWNRTTVGNVHQKLGAIKQELTAIQDANNFQDEQLRVKELELLKEYEKLLTQEEILWYQKSRVNWLKWGDKNTSFFHKTTLIRRQRNYIHSLKGEDNLEINDREQIERHVLSYFSDLYKGTPQWTVMELPHLLPMKLNQIQNQAICQVPTSLEIWKIVQNMPPYKSPGPDGYPGIFYQKFWHIIGNDVCHSVKEFFRTASMPHDFNHTYIVLIPKIQIPRMLNQYRPISLCNVVMKIISKLLVQRMRPFLSQLISPVQAAFVPDRSIRDNVLIHHEVCHAFHKQKKAKKPRKKRMKNKGMYALKLDFAKAYDKVNWNFLRAVLQAFGFLETTIRLIMACVESVSYSILINGSPVGKIKAERGLRQGDPLSPYLFILCQQVLSAAIQRLELDGRFQGIQIKRSSISLSHLMFADDILIYGNENKREAHCLLRLLHRYCVESGQEINFQKSSIMFSKNFAKSHKNSIRQMFNIRNANTQGKYLGIPLLSKRPVARDCQDIIHRVSAKLAGWKSGILTQIGKATLIQSVLNAQPIYFMSCHKLPQSVLDRLDQTTRNFFWRKADSSKGVATICWDRITQPWRSGGLNLKRYSIMNKALLMKAAWHLYSGKESLWVNFMKSLYFPSSSFREAGFKPWQSYIWRHLVKLKPFLEKGCGWIVANGSKVNIFTDIWLQSGETIPSCQISQRHRNITKVSQLINADTGDWNPQLISQFWSPDIVAKVTATPITKDLSEDKLIWRQTSSGRFSVASAYRLLMGNASCPPHRNWLSCWHLNCPQKIKLHLWKSLHNVLPTADLLNQRIKISSGECCFCQHPYETTNHLWLKCPFSRAAWMKAIGGATQSCGPQDSLFSWYSYISSTRSPSADLSKEDLLSTIANFGWALWLHRNQVIFHHKQPNISGLVNHFHRLQQDSISIKEFKSTMIKRNSQVSVAWKPPSHDTAKINFDGAFRKSTGQASIGVVIRNSQGKFLGAEASFCHASSAVIAEAFAVVEGLKLAIHLGLTQVELEGDSLVVIKLLSNPHSDPPWQILSLILEARRLADSFVKINFSHMYREGNQVADLLANYALDKYSCLWVSRCPSFLSNVFLGDVSGQMYVRNNRQ